MTGFFIIKHLSKRQFPRFLEQILYLYSVEEVQKNIEAIIFAAESPIKVDELLTYLNKTAETPFTQEEIEGVIFVIKEKYTADLFPFELGEVGGGYQFLTKADYHVPVSGFLNRNTVKRLTTAALESLAIIAYKQPVTKSIIETIRGVNADYTIQKLMEKELVEIAGGYQFLTKGAYHNTVAIHLKQTTKKRLSQAALETLALIAYKQPVIKSELEEIRGVSCDYALQKLLEKELVFIAGRSDGPGRPLLYGTTDKFMDYLGINNIQDLPKPKDFKEIENTVGEVPTLEESPTES